MAANEVPMNVDIPQEIKDRVEKTALRLKLAGDKTASKKRVVAEILDEFLAEYEQRRLKTLEAERKPKK
jgi:hypothetical protein